MTKTTIVVLAFLGIFAGLCGLVWAGKANAEILAAPIAAFIGWMSPSPKELKE